MLTQEQQHERILYPVTRVRTEKAGGSGVLVYSKEDSKRPGTYINIVLTCEHVVDSAIKVQEEWHNILKKNIKKDFLEEVTCESFVYDGSKLLSANSSRAEIIAYDKHHDVAAVKLLNTLPQKYVATVYPKDEIKNLRLFDPIWVSGCSLLHDPFASSGELTYLREVIEQKTYC
ncbi:MAG: trypsin-like peptidase domain-containing protein, partial [bacterium]